MSKQSKTLRQVDEFAAAVLEAAAVEMRRLHAQRDALLEAYRKMKNVAAAYSNFCDDNASTSKLEREFEAADAIARAAIKAVEDKQ
jgi:hypothetical protein